jgi:hypothetical protein
MTLEFDPPTSEEEDEWQQLMRIQSDSEQSYCHGTSELQELLIQAIALHSTAVGIYSALSDNFQQNPVTEATQRAALIAVSSARDLATKVLDSYLTVKLAEAKDQAASAKSRIDSIGLPTGRR